MVQTRSMVAEMHKMERERVPTTSIIPQYEVNIDFDEAHDAWMQNKKDEGNGTYKYICGKPTKKGVRCVNTPSCKVHN